MLRPKAFERGVPDERFELAANEGCLGGNVELDLVDAPRAAWREPNRRVDRGARADDLELALAFIATVDAAPFLSLYQRVRRLEELFGKPRKLLVDVAGDLGLGDSCAFTDFGLCVALAKRFAAPD